MGSVAYQELTSAMNNGWENDDSRKAMLLQEQRAGNVKVRVPKDKSRPIP